MKSEDHKYQTLLVTLISLALLLMLLGGCSTDKMPLSNSSETVSVATDDMDYPELTDDYLASCLPEGYRIAQIIEPNALDGIPCAYLYDQKVARPNNNTTLNIQGGIRMTIGSGAVTQNTTIRMVAPIACLGVIDCYPHPYQFNQLIEIRWRLSQFDVPPSMWDSFVPYYWNDVTNSLELMGDSWLENDELVMRTNHFSRYIVAVRIGG